MSAVDYSFARYTGAQLKEAGVYLVVRYLGPPGTPKAITKAELATLLEAGVVICFVYELTANDAESGVAGGAQHARAVNGYLAALGLPTTQPVYFAADQDIADPTDAVPYWVGIATVRPASTNGAYGEGALTKLLRAKGLVGFTWQSESTAFPDNAGTLPTTNIQQVATGGPLPTTDLDVLFTADVGQYPRPTLQTIVEDAMSNFPNAVAVALTEDGNGAWVAGSDGGVGAYGDAEFHGSLPGLKVTPAAPIVDIVRSFGGQGYYLVGSDGGVFGFGDAGMAAPFASYPALPANARQGSRSFGAGSLVPTGPNSYVLVALDGSRYGLGS